jgi:hypothetical protein
MTGHRYRTKPAETTAVQFDGANLEDLRQLVPPEVATFERVSHEPAVVVTAPGREPRLVHEGWWVHYDGSHATVSTPESFAQVWEPAVAS